MFVSQQQFKRNLKLYFNDKSLPTGNSTERLYTSILDCCCNPKGKLAYNNIFKMQQKNDFVSDSNNTKLTFVQKNQITLNSLIIEYVENRLKFQHLFNTPICPKYLAIYDCSTLKLNA